MARFGRTTKDTPAARGSRAVKPAPGKSGGKTPTKPKVSRRERLGQFKQAFTLTKAGDPKLVPILLVAFLLPFLVILGLGILLGHPYLAAFFGLLVAALVTMAVFGRRLQRTAYSQVEGQLGAAAAVLQNMRGDWRVTPAVGYTQEQDLLHRVVGRPGVVLVAEGQAGRTRRLVVTEKKKLVRFVGETPVYDVLVGDGEGMVPLRDLERHFVKLPRNIKPALVNDLDRKLKALGGGRPPIPKGPVPMNGRVPRGKMR
jgi:Domain of unknown function (DUF4191)